MEQSLIPRGWADRIRSFRLIQVGTDEVERLGSLDGMAAQGRSDIRFAVQSMQADGEVAQGRHYQEIGVGPHS